MAKPKPQLDGVEALVFDVFGTTVNWRSAVVRELERLGKVHSLPESYLWGTFAQEWRTSYFEHTYRVANGGEGASNVDVVHREILERMLNEPRWSDFGKVLDGAGRGKLTMIWHTLDAWPDTVSGLQALRQHFVVVALSNGNVRLLADMAKHSSIPWDVVFSTELFNTFKPNLDAYTSTLRHLSLSEHPERAAMVATHAFDLRGAKKAGMKTVYVHRPDEEAAKNADPEREFDLVVGSFEELLE